MKTSFKAANPDDIVMVMTFTMTLGQWKEVDEAIRATPHYSPPGRIHGAIQEMVRDASANFRAEEPA